MIKLLDALLPRYVYARVTVQHNKKTKDKLLKSNSK